MSEIQILTKTDAQKLVSQMHRGGTDVLEIPGCFSAIDPDVCFRDYEYFDECRFIIIPDTISLLSAFCFEETNIHSVNMPGVRIIGEFAFNKCTRLESVNAPKVERIDDNAFSGCTGLKSIELPSIISIRSFAFFDTALTEFVIPTGTKHIGFSVFFNEKVPVKIDIGISTPFIEPSRTVSYWCADSQNTLYYTADGSLYSKDRTILYSLYTDYDKENYIELPGSVKIISEYALADISAKKLTIPSNVTRICKDAFTYAEIDELEFIGSSIMLDDYAGIKDSEIRRFTLPNGHTCLTVGSNYIIDRDRLIYVSIDDTENNVYDFEGVAPFTVMGTQSVHYHGDADLTLCIPNSVISIDYWAICNDSIKKVQLPSSVVDINNGAFDEYYGAVDVCAENRFYWSKEGATYDVIDDSLPINSGFVDPNAKYDKFFGS